ncbi:carbohydrate-binding protein [Nocardia mexicana]|uniref:Carbohydrate binding protein n=1 Tax=Nocardia mexicana TaxID=279262 RepID=A0A370GMZ1_9NOCA|nr:carbohydrate binding protein [Nocardia mexicana]
MTAEWHLGARFEAGDTVTFNGIQYQCLQAHTVDDAAWTPEAASALWAKR